MADVKVVEVENLVALIHGRRVLDGITLSISAGRFTGLIGPNGAGKTTLLRVLLGLITPREGIVRVFGHRPGEAHNLIGYVPQTARFDTRFPICVRDVVMMGRYNNLGPGRFPGKEDRAAVEASMDHVGVLGLAGKRFGSLSGGESQRVLIARALCGKPRLLLLDEPVTGVDVVAQDNFYKMLRGLIDHKRMTVLLVSHDIGVITSMVDDLICLNQKVFCHGAPAEALSDSVIGKTYGSEAEIVMHAHAVPHRTVDDHRLEKPDA